MIIGFTSAVLHKMFTEIIITHAKKKINRQHFEIFFLFCSRKQDLTFHANSPLFSEKKNIRLLSVEFALSVVKVKLETIWAIQTH